MREQLEATGREAVLVEDAAQIRIMGQRVLEALPLREVPYEQVDPFILVHEARARLSNLRGVDTKHPHRGFDNLWYLLEGSVSTGHSTGPGEAMERARLSEGALLVLRTGRGAWHAEAIGADELDAGQADAEFRGVLFWVNLARKDKQAEPSAQVLLPDQIPVRQEGDATVRVLVGEALPFVWGRPQPSSTSSCPQVGRSLFRSRRGSTALPMCSTARRRSAPTDDGRGPHSSSSSGPANRSRSPTRLQALVPADGGRAVRRGTGVQRSVRGLETLHPVVDERRIRRLAHAEVLQVQ